MEYFSIGSGSSGNCAYIGSGNTKLLLDAGISGKGVKESLEVHDIDIEDIDGILITHEHRDHVACLGVLARRYKIPIYATSKTIGQLSNNSCLGAIDKELFVPIGQSDEFNIGDIRIESFPITHDAVEPVAYKFKDDNGSLGIVTDIGCFDENIINAISNLDAIVLEANHDIRMLETGIYPYQLKRRIASDLGHLSNEDCGILLSKILHDRLKWIVLAHLSAENNYDKLALESVYLEITIADNKYRAKDFPIYVAPRKNVSDIFYI